MAQILVVDDDRDVLDTMSSVIESMGHRVLSVTTSASATRTLLETEVDVVLLDVRLPDGDGLDLLTQIREVAPAPEVIIMTGFGDSDGAELAIKNGAWDYIEKPSSLQKVKLTLSRAVQYQEEKRSRLEKTTLKRDSIIGSSVKLEECLDTVAKAAMSEADVLITGETGTGKELFATTLHQNSKRAKAPFVVVDCTALPKTLVESMLFGHVKGAYTGAVQSQEGIIKQADGGTLFLDEVGELPLSIQKRFLRVLQERSFRPVGAKALETSNFRLIAATNRDLDRSVEKGEFRADLLFRLRSLTITLPPLRERREDIKALALHHIDKLCKRYETEPKGIASDFFDALRGYDWPGNVRELNQALEKALIAAGPEPMLFAKDLPVEIRIMAAQKSLSSSLSSTDGQTGTLSLSLPDPLPPLKVYRDSVLDEAEKQYLTALLGRTRGNVREARRTADLSRSRFYTLLKKHNIDVSEHRISKGRS